MLNVAVSLSGVNQDSEIERMSMFSSIRNASISYKWPFIEFAFICAICKLVLVRGGPTEADEREVCGSHITFSRS